MGSGGGSGFSPRARTTHNTLLNEARSQKPMELLPTTYACSSAVRWGGRVGERRVTSHGATKVRIPKQTCIFKVGSCFVVSFLCTTVRDLPWAWVSKFEGGGFSIFSFRF